MSGLFRRKKNRPLVVPPPPHGDLPIFPSASEADLSEISEEPEISPQAEHMIDDLELPEEPEVVAQGRSSTFIKIDTFRAVINEIMDLRSRLEKSGKIVTRLEEVQEQQNNLLKLWHHNIKTMREKLVYADEVLFKRR